MKGTLFKKLQAVNLVHKNGIKETARFLNIFPVSIRNWVKLINRDEVDLLYTFS